MIHHVLGVIHGVHVVGRPRENHNREVQYYNPRHPPKVGTGSWPGRMP